MQQVARLARAGFFTLVAFVAVVVVAGLAIRRIWTATEAPPAKPSQRES